jgi:hypothetical protein
MPFTVNLRRYNEAARHRAILSAVGLCRLNQVDP